MGKVCAVCAHPERGAIDRALQEGDSPAEVARRHEVSVYSVESHRQNHLLFRSKKHTGAGFFMAGADSITISDVKRRR